LETCSPPTSIAVAMGNHHGPAHKTIVRSFSRWLSN